MHHLDAALDFAPDSFEVRKVRVSVQSRFPKILGRRGATFKDGIVLDQMFRQIEDIDPAMAAAMVPIYDFLTKVAPDVGDWTEGREKAEAALESRS